MKHTLILLLSLSVLSLTITAQEEREAAPSDGPVMEFESTVVDYGSIDKNSDPLRVFKFSNSGTAPLVISNAKGSCGCTVPSYPKEPILPGQEAEIEVRYDTKRVGQFAKTVTLTTNAVNNTTDRPAGTFVLQIKGKVNQPGPGQDPVEIQLGKDPE